MYCRKCGKQIDYDEPICNECREAEIFFDDSVNNDFSQPVGDPKEGFGLALASTIIGAITLFIIITAITIITDILVGTIYNVSAGISSIISTLCLGGAIPALIFGIKSIKCFIAAKRDGRIKPVATLVCGIIGLVLSALAMFYVLLLIILMCAII